MASVIDMNDVWEPSAAQRGGLVQLCRYLCARDSLIVLGIHGDLPSLPGARL